MPTDVHARKHMLTHAAAIHEIQHIHTLAHARTHACSNVRRCTHAKYTERAICYHNVSICLHRDTAVVADRAWCMYVCAYYDLVVATAMRRCRDLMRSTHDRQKVDADDAMELVVMFVRKVVLNTSGRKAIVRSSSWPPSSSSLRVYSCVLTISSYTIAAFRERRRRVCMYECTNTLKTNRRASVRA